MILAPNHVHSDHVGELGDSWKRFISYCFMSGQRTQGQRRMLTRLAVVVLFVLSELPSRPFARDVRGYEWKKKSLDVR